MPTGKNLLSSFVPILDKRLRRIQEPSLLHHNAASRIKKMWKHWQQVTVITKIWKHWQRITVFNIRTPRKAHVEEENLDWNVDVKNENYQMVLQTLGWISAPKTNQATFSFVRFQRGEKLHHAVSSFVSSLGCGVSGPWSSISSPFAASGTRGFRSSVTNASWMTPNWRQQ